MIMKVAQILGYEGIYPIVECFRKHKGLLSFRCPFCKKEHTHGASGNDSPLGAGDGHRIGHCIEPEMIQGYILRECPANRHH